MTAPSVVYVLPDKVGGVFTVVKNLLQHRPADGWAHHAVLTDNRLDGDARTVERLAADGERRVEYRLPLDNLYSVLRRLARAIPAGPGVLVANDWLELAMLSAHPLDRTVVSISHGDFEYYYDLAERHESLIHCFVALTDRIHRRLCERLPHRRDSIVKLPHGVAIPVVAAPARAGRAQALLRGAHEREQGHLRPAGHRRAAPRAGHRRHLDAGRRRARRGGAPGEVGGARPGSAGRVRSPRRRSWRSTPSTTCSCCRRARKACRWCCSRRWPPASSPW